MAKAHTDKTGIIHVIFVRNCLDCGLTVEQIDSIDKGVA